MRKQCSASDGISARPSCKIAIETDLRSVILKLRCRWHGGHLKVLWLKREVKSARRAKSRGNTLTIHFSKICSIGLIGEQMTFTVALEQPQQNFVGNGVVIPAVWLPNEVL